MADDKDKKPHLVPVHVPEQNNVPADDNPNNYFHWYCLSFNYSHPKKGSGHCCAYMGYDEMIIPMREVEVAKHYANPEMEPDALVLIAATYLGFMTHEDFTA